MRVQYAQRAFSRFELEREVIRVQPAPSVRHEHAEGMLCDQGMQPFGTRLFVVIGKIHCEWQMLQRRSRIRKDAAISPAPPPARARRRGAVTVSPATPATVPCR